MKTFPGPFPKFVPWIVSIRGAESVCCRAFGRTAFEAYLEAVTSLGNVTFAEVECRAEE